jgi:hypothetical protein
MIGERRHGTTDVVDLTSALRSSVHRAGPDWPAQPSRLRLCLDETLGADAPRYRTQVHQLVVAAEERVPAALSDAGSNGAPLGPIAATLAASRGWDDDVALWAVGTWAAALGVPVEASAGQVDPALTVRPGADPTVLPGATPIAPPGVDATVLPTPSPSPAPAEQAGEHEQLGLPVAVADLPTAGTASPTRRAAAVLGHDVDIAFAVRTGPGPLTGVPFAVVAAAGALLGGPNGFLICALATLALIAMAFASPYRVLAIRGDRAWLMSTRHALSASPKAVIHEGPRSEMQPAGGWLLPVLRFGGQRLRFFVPTTTAGRLLARGADA